MKQVQDLVKGLLLTLTDITNDIEEVPDPDGKFHDLLIAIDSAYNEISYALSDLS